MFGFQKRKEQEKILVLSLWIEVMSHSTLRPTCQVQIQPLILICDLDTMQNPFKTQLCPLQNGNYWCLLPLAAVRKKPLSGAWDTEAINRCLWFAYYCCCYHYDCNIINRVNLIFKKSFCFNLSSHI